MSTLGRGRPATRALWVLALCVLLPTVIWFLGYEKQPGNGKVKVTLVLSQVGSSLPARYSVYLEAASGVAVRYLVRQAMDQCVGKGQRELVFVTENTERRFEAVSLRRWRHWHLERCVDRMARWTHNRLGEIGFTKAKYAILRWNHQRILENPGQDWNEMRVSGDYAEVLAGDLILAVAKEE